MTTLPHIEQIADRVDRLLARHEALQRDHTQLLEQIQQLSTERDALQSRLNVACTRIDALLARLPGSSALTLPSEADS